METNPAPSRPMHVILLINFGPPSMPDKPNRQWAQAKRDMLDTIAQHQAVGGQIHEVFWTAGSHDLVVHAQVRDQLAAHTFSLVVTRKLRAQTDFLSAVPHSDIGPVFDVLHATNGP
jgi:uncharacterized protein with GYD domain